MGCYGWEQEPKPTKKKRIVNKYIYIFYKVLIKNLGLFAPFTHTFLVKYPRDDHERIKHNCKQQQAGGHLKTNKKTNTHTFNRPTKKGEWEESTASFFWVPFCCAHYFLLICAGVRGILLLFFSTINLTFSAKEHTH